MPIKIDAEIQLHNGGVRISVDMTCDAFLKLVKDLQEGKKARIRTPKVKETVEESKKRLYKLIADFNSDHKDLYPSYFLMKFYEYWIEEKVSGGGIRFTNEKFFSLGKRLLTFWQKVSDEDKKMMWEKHREFVAEKEKKKNELFKNEPAN